MDVKRFLTHYAHHFHMALEESLRDNEAGQSPTKIVVVHALEGRERFVVQVHFAHVVAFGLVSDAYEIETGILIGEMKLAMTHGVSRFADSYQLATSTCVLLEQLLFGARAALAAIASLNDSTTVAG